MKHPYKIFNCSYSKTGSWGYYRDIYAVVVAETKSEALGLLLMRYPDVMGDVWTFEEININESNIVDIYEHES